MAMHSVLTLALLALQGLGVRAADSPRQTVGLALLLLASRTGAVRKAEINFDDNFVESSLNEERAAPIRSSARVSLSNIQKASIQDEVQDCCCRTGPCSRAVESSRLAVQREVNGSVFNSDTDTLLACCNNVSTSGWFNKLTRCRGGKITDRSVCDYEAPITASIDTCKEKLTWFFRLEEWYTLLPDYGAGGLEINYKAYVPCLAERQTHVNDVVIDKSSYFNSGGLANPIRTWVVTRPECGALSKRDLMSAIELSYDEMCPFPIKNIAYVPNFQPERACTYNKTNGTIFNSDTSRCPEGHRCACPFVQKQDVAPVSTRTWTRSTSIFTYLSSLTASSRRGTWVDMVTNVLQIGILPVVGSLSVVPFVVATGWVGTTAAAWIVGQTAIGGMAVFGVSKSYEYLMSTCEAKIGCYPLDCTYEEATDSCRIELETDESDPRNPYWFMPPPLHKCGITWRGVCHLSTCTAGEARQQMVGEAPLKWGMFGRAERSTVFNCQPLLTQDMTIAQVRGFEDKVRGLRTEEHELARRTTILLDQLHRYCYFLSPTEFVSAALCMDGNLCDMVDSSSASCCALHGGLKQCPGNSPQMCADNTCDNDVNNCIDRGGVKECAAMDRCPWLIPQIKDDFVECNDGGDATNTSDFNSTEAWCQGRAGLRTCPWNYPLMCESKSCNGEHCCATDCSQLGGQRACGSLVPVEPSQNSGAPRLCRFAWQVLSVALLCTIMQHSLIQ